VYSARSELSPARSFASEVTPIEAIETFPPDVEVHRGRGVIERWLG